MYNHNPETLTFLRPPEFVNPKTKRALINMTGPVWDNGANKPTGYGVKLLVDYLLNVKPSMQSK